MRNYYLKILKLPPDATEEEIKTAYRRLSKQYHPDRNPQPEAEDSFIAITEAYNYLTNHQPSYSESTTYQEPEVSDYEQWRRQAQARARQRVREEAEERQALIRKLLKWFNPVAMLILGFNLLLTADYLLPKKSYTQNSLYIEKVFKGSEYRGRGRSYQYDDLHFEDFTMRIDRGQIKAEESFESAVVIATVIFNKPQAALLSNSGQTKRYNPAYGVYQVFGFIIPLMLVLFVLYQYVIRTLDHRLTLAIFMLVILCIQLLAFAMV